MMFSFFLFLEENFHDRSLGEGSWYRYKFRWHENESKEGKAILGENDRLYLRLNLEKRPTSTSRTIRVVREGDFLEAGLQFEGYPGVVEKGLFGL